MRVTTEIDSAGQVKQPLPHAPHDIQVTPGSKLRIDIIWNNEDDVEDVNQALFESITPFETHLGAFFTSMVPKSSEMVSRVGNIYMYFRKGSLEDCEEHDKKLDGYALIFAARGSGRLGYTFPSDVCLDEVLSFLYDLICVRRGNATNGAASILNLASRIKSDAADRPQHKPGGAAIQLIFKWYRASGCRALENERKTENPTRLPFNIYIMCNEKRAVPGLYVQPKTPLSLKGKYEIGETHDLERSGTETPVKQKEDHTADDLSLHKCEHVRAATCRNLTSIALENVKDLPGYSIAQHTTTLRVCYLLFRAKEYKAINDKTLPEPCIKCISEAFTRKQLEDGLKWAISEIESLLSLPLSPQFEIHDRMTCYQKELNIQPFPFEKTKETMFKSRGQVIAALQFKRRFELEKQDYGVVRDDSRAQVIYAVACLLVSNHSPPKNLQQDDLDKIFDQFIRWLDHKNTS
ncbi:uncharacterized protein FPRO_14768 [Fusarium proliferatum ET1]|uniref:Uncharacterized protein n=1 Tax=Fusarium proliferatum (strain ET1) TaxID=1227346 RepID=A0A1L7WAV1_FUSPR|nr:uncharacterized protein FPRO_14768 [Fusarium proliferatum ET1]CZR49755.1 uncharacterized protein FPRO_14768 [Fusarium proliferatum ET1]